MRLESIPWSQPGVGEAELAEVSAAFEQGWLTMGPRVAKFETLMARRMEVKHAIAVSNGSVALEIALKILGVEAGDEVIVPAITYFATSAAVSRLGAIPVFVDIDPQTMALDHSAIEAALAPQTKGIIFIDYGGNPARIDELKAVAHRHGLFILQDAAQSLGGQYQGRPLGSQTPISTMSFHMAKVMSTVEGGMLFTDDDIYAREARIYRNQGESSKYHHSHLGYNARMTDIMAAIGLVQVEKLTQYLASRKAIAQRYNAAFDAAGVPYLRNHQSHSEAANFLYTIFVQQRDIVASSLKEQGIDTRVCYPMPLYRQAVYAEGGAPFRNAPCPVSESLSDQVLNLPIFPGMTEHQVDRVVAEVCSLLLPHRQAL